MTINATLSQIGREFFVGTTWLDSVIGPAAATMDDAPGPIAGLQFTVPTDQLWRSFDLTITPYDNGVVDRTGTLTVNFCRTPAMQPFSDTNFPSTQPGLIEVYSEEITWIPDTPVEIPIPLTIDQLQTNSGVGNFDSDSIMSTIRHELFNGTIAFTLLWADAGIFSIHSPMAPYTQTLLPTLVGDNTPALYSGLPTTHHRMSRADSCPRCGQPIFREQLVRDGYTKSLVCSECWDRAEERYPLPKHPKEINP